MKLHVNQHFKAYHALTDQVQSLLTKPQLHALGLVLIRPQNSKGKPKYQYYFTQTV